MATPRLDLSIVGRTRFDCDNLALLLKKMGATPQVSGSIAEFQAQLATTGRSSVIFVEAGAMSDESSSDLHVIITFDDLRLQIVHEGKVATLKRFKDDANEVRAGLECGIKLDDFNGYQVGDVIECFEIQKVRAAL